MFSIRPVHKFADARVLAVVLLLAGGLALAVARPGGVRAQDAPPQFSAKTGVPFTGAGVVVDSSCTDVRDVTIRWGDGTTSPPSALTPEAGGTRISGTHTYRAPGDYLGAVDLTATCNGEPVRVVGNPGGTPLGFIVHVTGALPAPVLGTVVNASVVKGTVLVSLPAGASTAKAGMAQKGQPFIPLGQGRQIPVGSVVDTRRGTVRLTSATGSGSKTQSGDFLGGIFQTLQSRKRSQKGLTELRLKGSSFGPCKAKGAQALAAAKSKRKIRSLRGNAKGRFRTRGRYSAATVRGTDWTVTDRCDGTLTSVKRGKVAVSDFRRQRTIVLRSGKKYLARGG